MSDLRAYQPAFTAGELSPALHARVDLAKYSSGLKMARNVFIHPHGGASNRAGLEFVREVKDSTKFTKLIPFQFNEEQSYIIEAGVGYGRIFRDGGLILSGGSPYEFATPYAETALGKLVYTQEADVMYITHVNYPPRKLGRLSDTNWTFTVPTFAPATAAPSSATATANIPGGSSYQQYKVSAIDATSGEEGFPVQSNTVNNDLTISGHYNDISWASVANAERYIIYKYDGGEWGYIGGSEGTTFRDENITADLSDTPQTGYNPFVGAGNYPRCSTFVDQRLAFASTLDNPQAAWLSQSGNYENFGYSRPRKASDGFEFRIRTRQVNEIRAMVPSRGLMVLTSGSENVVTGGQDEYLNPTNIVVKPQGYRGCAEVQPIVVGSQVLFAQKRGGVVRDFSYEFSEDTFTGKDLTILSRHLFKNRSIKAWAYAQAPYSVVWCVLDNGALVSLTYLKEHDVWAWSRHDTDGVFDDVAVIGEGMEDVPYFIVKRTIGGVTKRYIERLRTREFEAVEDGFFVDSGLSYSGAPVSTLSGLGHLEGKSVVALVDGNVVRGLTVSGGSVTLPNAGSTIHVGLPYEAAIQTLSIDLGSLQGLGTVQGRYKSVSEVTMRVENTRGVWVGTEDAARDSGKMIEFKQRASEAWNQAIGMLTGDIRITPMPDWTTDGSVVVKQFDPLPMTILSIMPDLSLGR